MTILSYRPKSLAHLALSLMFICLLVPVALQAQKKEQPQKKAKELRIDEVTVRDGSKGATAKQGFEFVSAGKNRVTVRSLSVDTAQAPPSVKGSYICACDIDEQGGTCDTNRISRTKIECTPKKCNTCILLTVIK